MPAEPSPDAGLESRLDAFFAGRPEARALFDLVRAAVAEAGPSTLRVTKSQVAFARRRAFAWAWTPDHYLRGDRDDLAPLVLSVAIARRDPSPRWKQVVEPRPGRFMHHLELHAPPDLDAEVHTWLAEAWQEAG